MTTSDASELSEADLDPRVRTVELIISAVLRIGVLSSLAVVVTGIAITFARNRADFSSSSTLSTVTDTNATFPHTLGTVVHGVGQLDGPALVVAGLLLLIATPVMRVAISIAAFVYQSDRTFVVITSVVLTLLLIAFALGRVE